MIKYSSILCNCWSKSNIFNFVFTLWDEGCCSPPTHPHTHVIYSTSPIPTPSKTPSKHSPLHLFIQIPLTPFSLETCTPYALSSTLTSWERCCYFSYQCIEITNMLLQTYVILFMTNKRSFYAYFVAMNKRTSVKSLFT